jgi:hypothetical protein
MNRVVRSALLILTTMLSLSSIRPCNLPNAAAAEPHTSGIKIRERNFFTEAYAGKRRDFTGNVGYELIPETTLRIAALGRSVARQAVFPTTQILPYQAPSLRHWRVGGRESFRPSIEQS